VTLGPLARVSDTSAGLLNLGRASGIGLLLLFVVSQTVLGVTARGPVVLTWQTVTALVLVNGAAVLAVLPGPTPLRASSTAAILGAVTLSTILITWNLPTDNSVAGYSAWHLGANTFLLFAVALRRRIGGAWIGMGIMTALTVLWSASTNQGVDHAFELDRQWGTLLVGTLFAFGLARTQQRIQSITQADNERLINEEVHRVAAEERSIHRARLERLAGPTLRSISENRIHDSAERARFLVLEAALRDQIRAKAFDREPLTSSARRARTRGVNVILLDDSNDREISASNAQELATWAAGHLDTVSEGTFTARLRARADGLIATIVAGDDDLQLTLSVADEPG
jgi:hypothetical protein